MHGYYIYTVHIEVRLRIIESLAYCITHTCPVVPVSASVVAVMVAPSLLSSISVCRSMQAVANILNS